MPNEKSNQINISEILSHATEQVKEGLVKSLLEELTESLKWTIKDAVKEEVDEFLKEHIKPEIQKRLLENKQIILDELKKTIEGIMKNLNEKFIEVANSKIQELDQWRFGKIIETIF